MKPAKGKQLILVEKDILAYPILRLILGNWIKWDCRIWPPERYGFFVQIPDEEERCYLATYYSQLSFGFTLDLLYSFMFSLDYETNCSSVFQAVQQIEP